MLAGRGHKTRVSYPVLFSTALRFRNAIARSARYEKGQPAANAGFCRACWRARRRREPRRSSQWSACEILIIHTLTAPLPRSQPSAQQDRRRIQSGRRGRTDPARFVGDTRACGRVLRIYRCLNGRRLPQKKSGPVSHIADTDPREETDDLPMASAAVTAATAVRAAATPTAAVGSMAAGTATTAGSAVRLTARGRALPN